MLVKSIITGLIAGLAAAHHTQSHSHSEASTHCETATKTEYGIATAGWEGLDWVSSLQSKYFTEGHSWTGTRVPVYTSEYTHNGTIVETGVAYLETGILSAEGYAILTSTVTVTDCVASPTATGECTPHHDHWHCPPGVAEPDHPPEEHEHQSGMDEPSGTCSYHVNYWHCPEGVPEPTSNPDGEPTSQDSEEEEGDAAIASKNGFLALAIALVATHKLVG